MRKNGGAGKKQQRDAIDEVEELLKSTQDDLLLKLTVNSHTKSSKSKSKFDLVPESSRSNAIDPDLDHRFQALRSKSNPKSKTAADHGDVDTLFARFAALKGPNATSASNSTTEDVKIVKDDSCGIADGEDGDEEDEVQKIINWAVDAARLDPSPASEIDDSEEDDDVSHDDDDDDSDDDEDEVTRTAVARKKKGSKK